MKKTSFVVSVFVVLSFAATAFGQPQSKGQQKCINKVNSAGAKVAQAQGKENVSCLKNAGKNKLTGTAQACLTLDPKQKVAKKKAKTLSDLGKFCGSAPAFALTDGATVNDAAMNGELALVADIFGSPLDGGVIDCDTDKPGCICQQKVLKDVEKVMATKLKEFVKCKKAVLKGGASSAADIEDCVNDPSTAGSIAADSKQKIAKKLAKLDSDVTKFCSGVGSFPGDCNGQNGAALVSCLDERIECRACLMINAMDGLSVDCDVFDDGASNESCVPEAEPEPAFLGALIQTTGRFTYQAIVGIAGANAECNAQFPGSHACTYAELLAAESAGQLVGAQDTAANPVTSFWAIDSTRPDDDQCTVSVPWDYATAHTGQLADAVTLNNGTGDLGALETGTFCLLQRWVGCCS